MNLHAMPHMSFGHPASRQCTGLPLALLSVVVVLIPEWAHAQRPAPLDLQEIQRIGVATGDPDVEFGRLAGVAVDERGVLYVVDALKYKLSAFTASGLQAAIARRGTGPGELLAPRALVEEDAIIHVLDPGNGRITRYRLDADTFNYVGQTRIPLALAWDFCLLDNEYFVLKYDPEQQHLIHRFTVGDGTRQGSFGSAFLDGDAILSTLTDVGHLECDQATRTVYVASMSTPIVRAYSTAGALHWQIQLEGTKHPVIERTGDGVRFRNPPGADTDEITVALALAPDDRLLVQFGEEFPGMRSPAEITDVTSVLLARSNGEILLRTARLPRVDVADAGYAYSFATDVFPRIIVYRWEELP
jgi:hypothetical protein